MSDPDASTFFSDFLPQPGETTNRAVDGIRDFDPAALRD